MLYVLCNLKIFASPVPGVPGPGVPGPTLKILVPTLSDIGNAATSFFDPFWSFWGFGCFSYFLCCFSYLSWLSGSSCHFASLSPSFTIFHLILAISFENKKTVLTISFSFWEQPWTTSCFSSSCEQSDRNATKCCKLKSSVCKYKHAKIMADKHASVTASDTNKASDTFDCNGELHLSSFIKSICCQAISNRFPICRLQFSKLKVKVGEVEKLAWKRWT